MCRGYPVESYCNTHWLTWHWTAQAKVEGIKLKPAWHWGCASSVINNPLGEPDCTPLYVDLLCVWGPVDGDHMFFLHFVVGLLK